MSGTSVDRVHVARPTSSSRSTHPTGKVSMLNNQQDDEEPTIETKTDPRGRSMCGGCIGSGRIYNPNTRQVERHEVCHGEGVR